VLEIMKRLKTAFFRLFTVVDQYVKFPALKKGEVGIQVGFDMYSPLTSDLFEMSGKVGAKGLVLGIDPDEWNHQEAKKIMDTLDHKLKMEDINIIRDGTPERSPQQGIWNNKP
jgi:hypothetical protein